MGDAQYLNTLDALNPVLHVADAIGASRSVPLVGRDRQSDVLQEQLVAVSAGKVEALAELYDSVATRIYGLARRCLRDPDAAEQITREVFAEIWLTATSFDPTRTSALAWVMTLTHRGVVDRLRSTRSHTEGAATAGSTPDAADDSQFAQRERAGAVHDLLARLSPLHRDVIEATYFDGRIHSELTQHSPSGPPQAVVIHEALAGLRALVASPLLTT